MTIPEQITGAKPVDVGGYEQLTDLSMMPLHPESSKLSSEFSGQDSGFSSRNSVASQRDDELESLDDGDDGTDVAMSTKSQSCHISSYDLSERCWRLKSIPIGILKALGIIGLLYLFICSLDLLGNSFQLLGGKAAGKCFSQSSLLLNPITGLMMGILATVLLQSSSTSSSIIITMVSSGILEVQPAIPIIMGCNIGTTVTNTLVSLAHSKKSKEFERAFSGATVHDVFNWLTVAILLPLESSAHVLYRLTNALLSTANLSSLEGKQPDLLKTLTKPLTKLIVQVDKKIITLIAENNPEADHMRILKVFCRPNTLDVNSSTNINGTVEICDQKFHAVLNYFHENLSDSAAGAILLVFSVIILTCCLFLLVSVLKSVLKDKITVFLKQVINSKLPYPFAWFTGYLAILIGAGLTVIVQSSSVFTSALTPLVGVGCLKLHRMYPLTLGSNIGTTATGILAALAAPSHKLHVALQLALCHLFFNICGIAIFYPLHPMRKIPINIAKFLGRTTAKYRWFAIVYLIVVFFFMPGFFFALSLAGTIPFIVVASFIACVILAIIILNILQSKCNTILPTCLQSWDFLPKCFISLEPLDKLIKKVLSIFSRCACCSNSDVEVQETDVASLSDDDDDDDEDDDAIEEDECTRFFETSSICNTLCCRRNVQSHTKCQDEGYSEPGKQDIVHRHVQFRPIYTGNQHSKKLLIHSSSPDVPTISTVSEV